MKVLFVDVGQGACQVILTGDHRAIVIDTGKTPGPLLRTLRFFRIQTIELLVVSHSHEDHSGGAAKRNQSAATGMLFDYAGAIEKIAYVYDSGLNTSRFGKTLIHQLKNGEIRKEQLLTIEASTHPQRLWQSVNGSTQLAAISPLAGDTLLSLDAETPNSTSVVLELRHRGSRIIFAADSEIGQWHDIIRLRNRSGRMKCEVLTMPHHGGLMSSSNEERRWFFENAVTASVVVVSVGTLNPYRHPRVEVISGAVAAGSHIMCTQITKKCCNDIESLRPGVIGPLVYPCNSSARPSYSRSKKKIHGKTRRQKRSRNVACGGTIVARLDDDGIHVERLDHHRKGVDRLVKSGATPLCRADEE